MCHAAEHLLAQPIAGCSAAQPSAVRSPQPCMIQCASCHNPNTHLGKGVQADHAPISVQGEEALPQVLQAQGAPLQIANKQFVLRDGDAAMTMIKKVAPSLQVKGSSAAAQVTKLQYGDKPNLDTWQVLRPQRGCIEAA